MAITGVLRPGHVQIRVLEMGPALKHYVDVLGLREVARDEKTDRVFLKAWDEHDHHSVVLRESDEAGMDLMGWKVDSPATLKKLSADIEKSGLCTDTGWVDAGEQPKTGQMFRFTIPTGHVMEIYAERAVIGNNCGTAGDDVNPDPWPDGLKGISPSRFDHCLLYGDDLDGTVKLFCEVLGFGIAEKVMAGPDMIGAFLSCSNKAHDVAFIRQPVKGKFHHASFLLGSWEQVLRAGDILSRTKTSIDIGPTRHGITRGETIYFFDPSGNRNEVFAGGYAYYPDKPAITWHAEDLGPAVAAAKAALKGPWGKLSVVERCAMLDGLVAEINHRFDDFLQAEIADTGKPAHLASHVDIPRGAANFQVFTDTIKNASTESFEMRTPDGKTARSYGVRVPRGVIAIICPWNLPLLLMTWKAGPALACGNTVVVKPSEATPSTATLLGEVMNKVGVPKGVYNVVNGFGVDSAGAFLTEHPDVNGITFTGETRTGTAIMKAGANGIRPVSLELGGKNAALVFADCDFDNAVATVTRSCFENAGQVCLGTERVYVQRPIFDKFVAALKEKAETMKPGRPFDKDTKIGPLVSKVHQKKVLGLYAKAREEGATIVTGGGIPDMPDELKGGCWVQPTIWTGLPETATVVTEEIFGPCCHIQPFDTEEEVLNMVNANRYGLATSIHTQDISRAMRLANAIEVGLCWVNSWFLRDLRTSFGGSKQSGIGREGGLHSLEFYTELRNVMVKY